MIKAFSVLFVVLFMVSFLVIAACTANSTAPDVDIEATVQAALAATLTAQPTNTPVPLPTATSTPAARSTPSPSTTPTPSPSDTPAPTSTQTSIPTSTPSPTPFSKDDYIASANPAFDYREIDKSDRHIGEVVCWQGQVFNIEEAEGATYFQAYYFEGRHAAGSDNAFVVLCQQPPAKAGGLSLTCAHHDPQRRP